jgi:hypothetical protein
MLLGDRITDEQRLPLSRYIEYIDTYTDAISSARIAAARCRVQHW